MHLHALFCIIIKDDFVVSLYEYFNNYSNGNSESQSIVLFAQREN